jgi:hypothetical protein
MNTADMALRLSRYSFRMTNGLLNRFGILLSKPSVIHGSPAFSGATLWARRLNQTKMFFDLTYDVPGDIIESGVHWGYGILIELTLSGADRRIYGFDSFLGHSSPTANDYAGGKFRSFDDSFRIAESDVWKTLILGTGWTQENVQARVQLVSGWIQETMPVFERRAKTDNLKIALVFADCDIYEPFKATLMHSWDILANNGVVVLGRLNNPSLMGKTRAVQEFLSMLSPSDYELCELNIMDNDGAFVKQSYLRKTLR